MSKIHGFVITKVIKQEAHQLVGPAKRSATKIRPKAVFRTSINADRKRHIRCGCRLCLHGCRATFGESLLNSGRII